MNEAHLMQILHTFKGAGLSVLIAIYHTREPMTAIEIATLTGYDRKSVSDALKKLQLAKYTTTTPGGLHMLGSTAVWGEILPIVSSSSIYIDSTHDHELESMGGNSPPTVTPN
jgi:hypothetical protein